MDTEPEGVDAGEPVNPELESSVALTSRQIKIPKSDLRNQGGNSADGNSSNELEVAT